MPRSKVSTQERLERDRRYSRSWYERNKKRKLRVGAQWLKSNRARKRATDAAWLKKKLADPVWFKKMDEQRFARNRRRLLRIQFGLTEAQYERMLKRQGGVCAICGRPPTRRAREKRHHLAVDHNHTTGRVRGLLCSRCNIGLAFVEAHGRASNAYLRRDRRHG